MFKHYYMYTKFVMKILLFFVNYKLYDQSAELN